MTQGKTAGDSENATSRRQRATTRASKQERGDDTREQHRPDRKGPTASNGSDGNHAASRRHRHGGKEQDTQEEPPRNIHGPATTSNRQQRPRRTQTETQTATAPPPLSNERGAERYDDRAERAERIASRHDGGTRESVRTRGTKQARQDDTPTAREDTEHPTTATTTTATTTPRPTCRKNGARNETRTNPPRYPIRSHHSSPIKTEEPSHPIHHSHRAVFASSPQTARGTKGTQ